MKYILLFLFSLPVYAGLIPSTFPDDATIQRTGSIVTVKTQGYCWWVDAARYEVIPETETLISFVILANMSETRPCGWVSPWVVAKNHSCVQTSGCDRPLYNENQKKIGRIIEGVKCEGFQIKTSIGGRQWQYATNKTKQRGLTLCEQPKP